ncbi:MAG: hypothetical protein ACTIJ9_16415 [Aequorivita sp.]
MKDILSSEIFKDNALMSMVGVIFAILVLATILIFVIQKINPKFDATELKARTKSWWVMATVFIVATLFNTEISFIAIAFLSFIAFREMYSMLGFRQDDRRAIF